MISTSVRGFNERSSVEKFYFSQTLQLNVRLIMSIRSVYDIAEIVGTAWKRKFDNRRFNFLCARARATPTGRIVKERKKKDF